MHRLASHSPHNSVPATRFVLIGGFLGAGKTTLIASLARRLMQAGKRVGIITNDQAANLVDTHTFRGQGFDVGEVAGACFCCSFDSLVDQATHLGRDAGPDYILAEPVGSCTDLVATVILPLEKLFGQTLQLAPYGVLLKPSHGKRILHPGPRSGFSPQAEYIFRKQLEEADYLMIGRADQLDEREVKLLRERLAAAAPDVPVFAVSPKSGAGVDALLPLLEGDVTTRRILELDYDVYADGEAELGWVNAAALLQPQADTDLDRFTQRLLSRISGQLAIDESEIAHLKCTASADGLQSVANVVSSGSDVEHALLAGRPATGAVQLIVNARVATDPDRLQQVVEHAVRVVAAESRSELAEWSIHSLRPGRPVPTHRFAAAE